MSSALILGNLSRLPGSTHLHRWADWAELLCLTSDGVLSVSDLEDATKRREDVASVEETDEPEDLEDTRPRVFPDSLSDMGGHYELTTVTAAEVNDAISQRALDVFAYIASRASAYGATYPFEIDSDLRSMRLKSERRLRGLRKTGRLYLFLLACANLRYVPKKTDQENLAAKYEDICRRALELQLPRSAEVHLFAQKTRPDARYNGLLKDKLSLLANDLGEERTAADREFLAGDTGDAGLDLVAWLPVGDPLGGRIILFGQCACTTKWVQKQHSATASALRASITLTVEPVPLCFIPFDFREVGGNWYQRRMIHGTVVIDRRRLCYMLQALDRPSVAHQWLDVAELGLDDIAKAILGGVA